MQTRNPSVAGQFYPARKNECAEEIREYLSEAMSDQQLPETIVSGIVPHAGWVFSGRLAAMVFSAIKQRHENVDTFIVFGAAHSYFGQQPAVYDKGSWQTPLGEVAIDEDLAEKVLSSGKAISDADAHTYEHSIEVQIPFIKYLFDDAKILPVLMPPGKQAVTLGEAAGEIICREDKKRIVCIGSTDLTHYGPRYGLETAGTGQAAFDWADNVNDREFIDLACKLEPEKMLASAAEKSNACGPGAAAAAVSAAKKQEKTKGILLAHTNSNEVMIKKYNSQSQESVGYAAIVI